jgi:hypothetical protein
MAGGMEAQAHIAERDGFAIACLRRAGEILPIAQPHEIERLPGGEHRAVACARVVGMAGDDGLVHRPDRVDVEPAAPATQAGRGRHQDVFRAHGT